MISTYEDVWMPQNWYQMYEGKVSSNEKNLYTFRSTSLGFVDSVGFGVGAGVLSTHSHFSCGQQSTHT
jgi:hypothetical protein